MAKQKLSIGTLPFIVTGTGVAVGKFNFFSSDKAGQTASAIKMNGRIRRIIIRQNAGGGATAVTLYLVHRSHAGTSPSLIPDEYVPVETSSMTPTASNTVAFLDSPISSEPEFQETLKLMLDVTAAAGAWTFEGVISVET